MLAQRDRCLICKVFHVRCSAQAAYGETWENDVCGCVGNVTISREWLAKPCGAGRSAVGGRVTPSLANKISVENFAAPRTGPTYVRCVMCCEGATLRIVLPVANSQPYRRAVHRHGRGKDRSRGNNRLKKRQASLVIYRYIICALSCTCSAPDRGHLR